MRSRRLSDRGSRPFKLTVSVMGNVLLFAVAVVYLAVNLIRSGHALVAAFTLAPCAALLVAFALSHTELGRSVLTARVAGPVPNQAESRSRYLLRVALWCSYRCAVVTPLYHRV